MNTIDEQFQAIVRALAQARGADKAITLASIAERLQTARRTVESIIEEKLADFPFLIVSGSSGYYIPTSASDINRYVHSLHSRHRRMQLREQTVIHKAKAQGWPYDGKSFSQPPAIQQELFA
jgi:hypothetical protein